MVRPTIFDYKYKDLSSNEKFIQAERDQMLYDLSHQTQNKNTNNVMIYEKTPNDYYRNIDSVMKKDEREYNKELSHKKQLKKEYSELRYKKDQYKRILYNMTGINIVAFFTIILSVFLVPISLFDYNSNTPYIIGTLLGIVIFSIVFKHLKRKLYEIGLNNIDKRLKQIRDEIKSS